MHLYIKPTCIHKSPFLQSFLTHFMESLHYQPSLFNLITAKTFTSISATMLCCKWNFHIHDCHKRPNNKAQPCRMFVQKGLTGGACFESVSIRGRKVWQWRPLQRIAFPTLKGHDPSFVCGSCGFLLPSKTQHEKKWRE